MKFHTLIVASFTMLTACGQQIAEKDQSLNSAYKITSYEIEIGNEKFVPSATIPDHFAAQMQNIAEMRKQQTGFSKSEAHIIIQFKEPLTALYNTRLKKMGISILNRINPVTWIASVDSDAAASLKEIENIRWAGAYPLGAKLSKDSQREEVFEWQKRSGGRATYSVLFHSDVNADEVINLPELHMQAELEDFDQKAFSIVKGINVVIDPADLELLASADIVRWIEAEAPPLVDDNFLNVQPLSNVDAVQAASYGLSGAGVSIGIWEAGDVIRATHNDLTPRVIIEAGQTVSQDNHAAHVAGTVGASGVNFPNAEGMAPAVTIASWDASSDSVEMTNAATSAGGATDPTIISASNHSNNFDHGWSSSGNAFNNFTRFGQYRATSVLYDQVVVGTDLIVMRAAGNDRNDVWNTVANIPGAPTGTRDCTQGGFGVDADCIPDSATAKNILTVGSMAGAAALSNFSSYGPTDDGRIKPDLVAQGSNVFSLSNAASDSGTITMSGTSMATPAVTGMVALVLEDANNLGITMTAAGMKALLLQTAQDVSAVGQATVGPDYSTGYGIADVQAAVDLLRLPVGAGLVQETLTTVGDDGAYIHPFYIPAGLPEVKVTLAWTDPAGNSGTPSARQLVNDLDLRLIHPDGSTLLTPWSLNPAAPGTAAARNGGDDTVNNVEQVSVLTPDEGIWFAQVTAKNDGSLALGPQDFALAGPLTPFVRGKSDIMLVLDKSNSMSWDSAVSGLSKIEALRSAASEFIDFVELVGGHHVGLVQFDTNVQPFVPAFGLQLLDETSAVPARDAVDSITPGGWTNIIEGVTVAADQLSLSSATRPDTVFLFSDGRHNRPTSSDVADIDTIMNDDTQFYSLGFGTDVDSTVMPIVAANHNGLHLEEQTLTPAQLSKLFLTIAGVAVDEDIIIDPDYPLMPGAIAMQSVQATKLDKNLTFAVHWNNKNEPSMRTRIFSPGRTCIISGNHEGFRTRAGRLYKLLRVDLPYRCLKTGEILHDGQWSVEVKNIGSAHDMAKIMVLTDSRLKLKTKVIVKGAEVVLEAKFTQDDKSVCKDVAISAVFEKRIASTGDSEKLDDPKSDYSTYDSMKKASSIAVGKSPVVTFKSAENEHLRKNGICKQMAHFNMPLGSGLHQVRIIGNIGTGSKAITRETIQSFYVK